MTSSSLHSSSQALVPAGSAALLADDDETTVPAVSADIARSLDVALAPVRTALAPYVPQTFEALLPSTGHAWNAVKEPVFTGDGMCVPDTFAVRRADTKQNLGVVGSRYHITQPIDLARDLDAFFQGLPIRLEGAMQVRGGSDLVLMAALPDEFALRLFDGKDVTHARVVFRTSFDGGSKTTGALMGKRLVCSNGLRLDGIIDGTGWGIRHTKSADAKRKAAVESLRQWALQWKGFSEAAARLSTTRLLPSQVTDIVTRVVLTPDEIIQGGTSERALRDASSQKQRKVETIIDISQHGMGTEIVGVRGSAWGLLQAVNEYTNHYSPARGDDTTRANRRIERVLDGDPMTARAFEILSAL